MMERGKTLESRLVHDGKVVRLSVDRVELPNGSVAELEVIRHQGAAAAVPLTADGEVLLVRQYRYATGGWLLEVPAGKLDPGEGPEICARREIEEEVGQRPGRLDALGWIWTTPGFTDEKIWLFLARDLSDGRQDLDSDEVLMTEKVPLAEALEKVHQGEICDGKSVCALLRAAAFLEAES
jgi:ADP-ribose pyrophosphatase